MPTDIKMVVQVMMQQRERLCAHIWTIVRDAQLVEDVLQELSVLAIEKEGNFPDDRRLIAWLHRAARLKALEALRAQGRLPLYMDDALLDEFERQWEQRAILSEVEVIKTLHACIEHLTPGNRQILTLRYRKGKKAAEVAKLLGRKVEAVYRALTRIHCALRDCVERKLKEAATHE
jgi:RNA polymerase sigma-70 factor (ECF subfamily)